MRKGLAASLVLALLASGCASVPPERVERDRVVLRAIAPCEQRYPTVRVLGMDDQGRLQTQVSPGNVDDLARFRTCAQEAVKRELEVGPLGAGQVPATARAGVVTAQLVGTVILVPALLNGVPATLLLDTGATTTIVRPALAQRAGIEVPPDAPKMIGVVVGGQRISLPLVRARALSVGEAVVEGIDVGVFDGMAHMPGVDGLLGGNFLNHFKVTIDRENRRLTLEPTRASRAAGAATPTPQPSPQMSATPPAPATPVREWPMPVWAVGDEWHLRAQGPTGGGTYVRRVEGVETVDDVTHFVVRSGARQTYYVKATLGLHLEKLNGAVVVRRTPAMAYDWPLRVGKSWELSYRREDADGKTQEFYRRCTVAQETTLKVPAGTFLTLHVVCRDRAERVATEAWYAEEVKGVVRERIVSNQGDRIDELVSYDVRRAP